jgi:2-dehydro-3-deoxyphosphogluconate aldolase/(4S)-4-hydroxy-2-oxoglutarate aldolase
MGKKETIDFIEKHKAIVVLRLPEADVYPDVERALVNGGINIVEITMSTPGALDLIEKSRTAGTTDRLIGVGTVMDPDTARRAIDAGAQFVVSPVVHEKIIELCNDAGVPVMPGAFTPTEIQHAWDLGADIVKVFPAGVLGPEFFRAVLAPMPYLKLMPTGGVSLSNATDWLNAGACAVGLGSSLINNESIENQDFAKIQKNAEQLRRIIG